MICQDVVAAVLVVAVQGEEHAVVGLLQGVLLTAQVPCRDGEEVLPGLLVRVILGLQSQESSDAISYMPGMHAEDTAGLGIHGQEAFKVTQESPRVELGHAQCTVNGAALPASHPPASQGNTQNLREEGVKFPIEPQ